MHSANLIEFGYKINEVQIKIHIAGFGMILPKFLENTNNTMKKILVLSLLCSVGIMKLNAQTMGSDYSTAVGLKIYPGALSVKHFVEYNRAVEGLAYFYNDGVRITGLYEIHGDINGAPGLKWYVGPGAHVGVWNDNWQKNYPDRKSGVNLGIDGVIGLDYKFENVPINISFDWQPSFNIVGYTYFEAGWGGLGIRYTF